jgi:S4 domain protein YaaA
MFEKVFISTEFITLAQFLKFAGIISNGGEAKFFLMDNEVVVNHEVENRRGRKLYPGYFVEVLGRIFVIKSNENK